MTTTTDSFVAITPGGTIEEDMLVGFYVLFGVPESYKSAITIRKNWRAAGLAEDRLPRQRQPVHVAQEAIRSVEGDASWDGTKARVIVNEVSETGTDYVGQATLQIWAPDALTIEFEKSLRVRFNKRTDDFEGFDVLDPDGYEHLKGVEQQIREHFETHAKRIGGSKIRLMVRHMLEEEARAENVSITKKSALYFVEREHKPLLDGIAEFLKTTYPASGLHSAGGLHTIPVVNDEGQRAWLRARAAENIDEDLRIYRDRLLDLVRKQDERKQGYRTDLIFNLQKQRQELLDRKQRFEGILGEAITELDQSSRLADAALTRLLREAQV
jgi:hypothetical protein